MAGKRLTVDEKKARLEAQAVEYDKKAEEYKAKAAAIRAQKTELDKPSVTLKDITARIKAAGIPPEAVMKALDRLEAKQ